MALQIEKYVPEWYSLHKKKEVSDVCEHGFLEPYYSKNDPRTGNLEFVVEGDVDHMIVPGKCYLKLVLELSGQATRKVDSKNVAVDSAKVYVANNILHSIFDVVETHVNGFNSTKTDKHHHYIGYLKTLCSFGEEPLETYFELSGWSKDTAGHMESLDDTDNTGLEERKSYFSGTPFRGEFMGKICSPLFFQEKVLPTQTSLKVIMRKAPDNFVLMHEAGTFTLKIVEAVFWVQKVRVTPMVHDSYIQLLEEDHPIPYWLNTPRINYYTIEQGSSQFMRDDVFLGKMPRRIIIGMVETDSYHGKTDKNPFNFQHFDLAEICLYKDGIPYPRPLTKLDFRNKICAEAYHNFMTSMGAAYSDFVPHITKKDYMNGYSLFSYDMSPDQLGSLHPASLLNMNSNIRLEMKFKNPLPKNITLLIYSESEHLMEIHRDRRVTLDF